ncbi:hypothetical protein ACFV84_36135 [Kitasatospora sp. NPDC059811]|uniref:hypothetical protein n=1 Tax=Streptomycetaceae TaxID=2062 RepID=UPI0007AF158B|nr:hypothetical protein [Streptomyces sp. MJM8645]
MFPTDGDYERSETIEIRAPGGELAARGFGIREHPEIPLTDVQRDAVLARLGFVRDYVGNFQLCPWACLTDYASADVRAVDWTPGGWELYAAYAELARAALRVGEHAAGLTKEEFPGFTVHHRLVTVFHPDDERLVEAGMLLLGGRPAWFDTVRPVTYSVKARPGQPVVYIPAIGRYLRDGEDPGAWRSVAEV